MKQKLHKM
jgi:hypothetical protein